MADTKDKNEDAPAAKKKGGIVKLLIMVIGVLVLLGGGVGAGLYAASSGMVGGSKKHKPADDGPQLVAKADQKAPAAEGGASDAPAAKGHETPDGQGGDQYASNYYALDKEFTANLQESTHFLQVGLAISTPYDQKEIDRIKSNEIAIRSAILLALGDTTEDQVFTTQGKKQLQQRLTHAINDTLQQKEGFGGVGNVYFTSFVVQ